MTRTFSTASRRVSPPTGRRRSKTSWTDSYNVDLLGGTRVSDQAWQNSFYIAITTSPQATLGCITACQEDFRADLATISIPVLIIHGDQDRIFPYGPPPKLPALLRNPAPP